MTEEWLIGLYVVLFIGAVPLLQGIVGLIFFLFL
jgi:hypothetical protein